MLVSRDSLRLLSRFMNGKKVAEAQVTFSYLEPGDQYESARMKLDASQLIQPRLMVA